MWFSTFHKHSGTVPSAHIMRIVVDVHVFNIRIVVKSIEIEATLLVLGNIVTNGHIAMTSFQREYGRFRFVFA